MKAQVAIEFMIIMGALLALMTSAVLLSSGSIHQMNELQIKKEAEDALSRISSKINTAFLEGEGFMTSMEVPETLVYYDYSLTIYDNYLLLEVENRTFEQPLLTKAVTQGSVNKGINTLENNGTFVRIS